jgi:hypothetical protein
LRYGSAGTGGRAGGWTGGSSTEGTLTVTAGGATGVSTGSLGRGGASGRGTVTATDSTTVFAGGGVAEAGAGVAATWADDEAFGGVMSGRPSMRKRRLDGCAVRAR